MSNEFESCKKLWSPSKNDWTVGRVEQKDYINLLDEVFREGTGKDAAEEAPNAGE